MAPLLSKGQASVLTVVIMVVMVVFSIYAMTEYSIIVQTAPTNVSNLTGMVNHSMSVATSSSTEIWNLSTTCNTTFSCANSLTSFSATSSQLYGKVAGQIGGDISSKTGAVTCSTFQPGRLILIALADSSKSPLMGLGVTASNIISSCANIERFTNLGQAITNSSGMVTFCCNTGTYDIDISYGTFVYTANATVGSGGLTCIWLFIPSGRVTISYSGVAQDLCDRNVP